MKPGRELDALVAEKVMGWDQFDVYETEEMGGEQGLSRIGIFNAVPCYSTDIAAAWFVAEKIQRMEPGHVVDIQCGRNDRESFYQVQIDAFRANRAGGGYWDCVVGSTEGESAAHAICLAALIALGVIEE